MTTESGPRHQRYEVEGGETVPESYELPVDAPERPAHQPRTTTADTLQEVANDTAHNRYVSPWRRRTLGAIAGVGLAAVSVGVGMSLGNDNAGAEKRPSVSAPANPGEASPSGEPSPESNFEMTEKMPTSVLDGAAYNKLDADAKAQAAEYHNMSLAEFSDLDVTERMAYARLVIDTYKPAAVEQLGKGITTVSDFKEPKDMGKDTKGQDIMNAYNLDMATLVWSLSKDGDPHTLDESRRADAIKGLNALYPDAGDQYIGTTGAVYEDELGRIANTASLVDLDGTWRNITVDYESPLTSGITAKPTKKIVVHGSMGEKQFDMSYNEVIGLDGSEHSMWSVFSVNNDPASQSDLEQLPPYETQQ